MPGAVAVADASRSIDGVFPTPRGERLDTIFCSDAAARLCVDHAHVDRSPSLGRVSEKLLGLRGGRRKQQLKILSVRQRSMETFRLGEYVIDIGVNWNRPGL